MEVYSDNEPELDNDSEPEHEAEFNNEIHEEITEFHPMVNPFNVYQENVNSYYQVTPEVLEYTLPCLSFIFLNQYDDIKHLENSSKIILPKRILVDFSKYEDIKYPLTFQINDSNILFSVYEFREEIDHIYLPTKIVSNLQLDLHQELTIKLKNIIIEKGTKIVLKPHTSNFLEIDDHKQFLETHLTMSYTTLSKGQIISIPYFEETILIDVLECEPVNTISLLDTDLEVDFEAPYDYVEPKPSLPTHVPIVTPVINPPWESEEKKEFVPFSGKGYRLGN